MARLATFGTRSQFKSPWIDRSVHMNTLIHNNMFNHSSMIRAELSNGAESRSSE